MARDCGAHANTLICFDCSEETQPNEPPATVITMLLTVLSSVALGKTIWID